MTQGNADGIIVKRVEVREDRQVQVLRVRDGGQSQGTDKTIQEIETETRGKG